MTFSAPTELVLAAVTLDLLVGDPPRWPHPVRAIGAWIAAGERRLRRGHACEDLVRGALLSTATVVLAGAVTAAAITLAAALSPALGWIVAALLAASAIALRGLADAALDVTAALEQGDLGRARTLLPALCGRDPSRLDEAGIARAVIESVAENASDAVVAPLFYLLLAGPVGAIAYKSVNTLDSMIGHRDERHLWFGRLAARLDDAVNWIPARITAAALVLAAAVLTRRGREAAVVAWRDAGAHASPNAGWPEAAMAGGLGLRLGGPVAYDGVDDPRAWLGDGSDVPGASSIRDAVDLLRLSSATALLVMLAVRSVL